MLYADQLLKFANEDITVFVYRWLADVSVLVTFAPTVYSFYESALFKAVVKGNAIEHPATKLYLTAEPLISASLHIFAFATAMIMFIVQNGFFAAYLLIEHAKVHFESIVIFYIISSFVVSVVCVAFAIKGCSMGPRQLQKYLDRENEKRMKRVPPNIALTWMRFSLGFIAFFINPFYQYVSSHALAAIN